MKNIVSHLRTFTSREGREHLEEFPVIRLVNDAFAFCREDLHNHGIATEFEIDEDVRIMCPYSMFVEVLLGIIYNARDAVLDRSNPRIDIRVYEDHKKAVIVVSDNGVGIPDEIRERVFEPFITGKEIGKGMGLGLTNAKNVVESMDGTITFQSVLNKGTQFFIKLPIATQS
jgi:C4-dicarboxylate-specific signal transduction histidine kinase